MFQKGKDYADILGIQNACTDILWARPANSLKALFEKF